LNLDEIEEVRQVWQFFRDRRPETYGEVTRTLTTGSAQAAD
jgi:N-carbamoylputrescine amidase